MKSASTEHVVSINCSECQNKNNLSVNSMNNLSSYFGLVDAKIRASDKDLHVLALFKLYSTIVY